MQLRQELRAQHRPTPYVRPGRRGSPGGRREAARSRPIVGAVLVLVTGPPATGKSTVAGEAAAQLCSAVLSWDWAMAALTPFEELQREIEKMEPARHRALGWALLFHLAQAELRAGRSIVLDGVAHEQEVRTARELADEAGTHLVVVLTHCSDLDVHRHLVEGRQRRIPGWYELEWERVRRSLDSWDPPPSAHLVLDAAEPLASNVGALRTLVASAPEEVPPLQS